LFVIIQESNVHLIDTVTLPPDRDFALVGAVQDQSLKKEPYLEIDTVQLRLRYGLNSPRTVINKNTKTCVIVCRNPYSRPIRLLKSAAIGIATPVDIREQEGVHLMLPEDMAPCPDQHPKGLFNLEHLEKGMQQKVLKMLQAHHFVFSRHKDDIGLTCLTEHKIDLKPEEGPSFDANRSMPLAKHDLIDQEIKSLENKGVVKQIVLPYRAFPTLAQKKDAASGHWVAAARMCVDFRSLNEKTIGHSRLLPKVSEVTDALCGATVFTKLDITSAFSQISMHPDSVEKIAFCNASSRKQFCYANMPYGLKNSSQTFSDLMDHVLTNLSFSIVISYIDALLVYSWAAAMRYPRYPWIPQILEPVCKFVHRPVCMLFYDSKFQRSSSNGSEMTAL
jgi:hypothetical protein